MTVRIFVVLSTFIVGVMLTGALVFYEVIPEVAHEEAAYVEEDRFLDIRFSAGTRRANLDAFGLPDRIKEQVDERVNALQKRDRGDLLKAMNAAADVAGALCSNDPPLPSRYKVTGILLSGEPGTRREVVSFDRVRNRVAFQEGYRPFDLEGLYKSTEIIPNAAPDAYAVNIVALLLGREFDRLEGTGDFSSGLLSGVTLTSLLNRRVEIEADLVEFFAQMHYLHEVARDPRNEFCGVRAGASFSGSP